MAIFHLFGPCRSISLRSHLRDVFSLTGGQPPRHSTLNEVWPLVSPAAFLIFLGPSTCFPGLWEDRPCLLPEGPAPARSGCLSSGESQHLQRNSSRRAWSLMRTFGIAPRGSVGQRAFTVNSRHSLYPFTLYIGLSFPATQSAFSDSVSFCLSSLSLPLAQYPSH